MKTLRSVIASVCFFAGCSILGMSFISFGVSLQQKATLDEIGSRHEAVEAIYNSDRLVLVTLRAEIAEKRLDMICKKHKKVCL